jgi:cullin 3
VLKKKGDMLYENFTALERNWLETQVWPNILDNISSSLLAQTAHIPSGEASDQLRVAGEKFLKALKQAWEGHVLCMGMTTDVLMYMVGLESIP